MRTKFFFNHFALNDLTYASFAVIKETKVVVVGGLDITNEESKIKPGHGTFIIKIPL